MGGREAGGAACQAGTAEVEVHKQAGRQAAVPRQCAEEAVAVIIWSPASSGTYHAYAHETVCTPSLCGRKHLWPPRGARERREPPERVQYCQTCKRVAEQMGYEEA